ncbi:MAG TPA: CDP-alcohol phosphatidyltransferase family protein [Opitutaceae bacterium]|nr:CDP-alcohol phosphatidyltransferase family protein [Opitutaceae bacterium]
MHALLPASADIRAACVLVAVMAGSFAVYGVRRLARGPVDYERVQLQGGTFFLAGEIMNAGYWLLQPVVRGCVRAGITPAMLTWFSLGPALGASLAAAYGRWALAAWGLLASSLLDVLDGAVARAQGRASRAGAVLDSTLDRYVEFAFFGGLLIHYRAQLPVQLLCFAAVTASMLVTYSTAKAEALGVKPPRGWMRRSDRMACLVIGALLSPLSLHWLEADAAGNPWHPWPMIAALGAIALFGHMSAALRFRALVQQVKT